MSETREQIAARVITEVSWTMDPHGFRIAAVHAAAGVSAGAKAVTDRVRAMHREWIEFAADPDLTRYERSTVRMCVSDVARLLDQIDAEMGVQQ